MDKARYPLFRDILIEDNVFSGSTGVPVYLASAGRVTIRGNTFDLTAPSPMPEPTRGGIAMDSAKDVAVIGNTWIVPQGAPTPAIHFDAETVTALRARRNQIINDSRVRTELTESEYVVPLF